MDSTQTRILVVLAVLLGVVGAALYLQGDRDPAEAADPEATAEVWSLDEDEIRAVRVERGAGALHLEQVDGAWQLREPLDAPADADQARDLVTALAQVERGIPVDVPDEQAEDFGLGPSPDATVTVTTADGAEHTLVVGQRAPVGFRTYVRSADGGIAAINGDLSRLVQAEAARYRDRHVLRFDPAEVRDVRISSAEGELHVSGSGKVWWLDGFTRADADKVDDLVVGLLELRFDQIEDAPAEVTEPAYEVAVTLEGGAVAELAVEEPAEGATAARVSTGDGRAGTVWADSLALLGQGPTDLGWRTAFGVRPEVADTVTFAAPDYRVEARRNGPEWTAEGRDAGRVHDGVSALSRAAIAYRRDPPARPEAEYTVTVTEGDLSWSVEVGPVRPDGSRAAVVAEGGEPFLIAPPVEGDGGFDDALDALAPPSSPGDAG
jgi:hypothetical protein